MGTYLHFYFISSLYTHFNIKEDMYSSLKIVFLLFLYSLSPIGLWVSYLTLSYSLTNTFGVLTTFLHFLH